MSTFDAEMVLEAVANLMAQERMAAQQREAALVARVEAAEQSAATLRSDLDVVRQGISTIEGQVAGHVARIDETLNTIKAGEVSLADALRLDLTTLGARIDALPQPEPVDLTPLERTVSDLEARVASLQYVTPERLDEASNTLLDVVAEGHADQRALKERVDQLQQAHEHHSAVIGSLASTPKAVADLTQRLDARLPELAAWANEHANSIELLIAQSDDHDQAIRGLKNLEVLRPDVLAEIFTGMTVARDDLAELRQAADAVAPQLANFQEVLQANLALVDKRLKSQDTAIDDFVRRLDADRMQGLDDIRGEMHQRLGLVEGAVGTLGTDLKGQIESVKREFTESVLTAVDTISHVESVLRDQVIAPLSDQVQGHASKLAAHQGQIEDTVAQIGTFEQKIIDHGATTVGVMLAATEETRAQFAQANADLEQRLRTALIDRYETAEDWAQGGPAYKAGAVVRHLGGLWQALERTTQEPQPNSSDWLLLANGVQTASFQTQAPGHALAIVRMASGHDVVTPVRLPHPVYRGVFEPGTEYRLYDAVVRDGSVFMAYVDHPQGAPAEAPGEWMPLGYRGRSGRAAKQVEAADIALELAPQVRALQQDLLAGIDAKVQDAVERIVLVDASVAPRGPL